MIRRCMILSGLVLAAVAFPLHAQGGCVDSPESPTLVLALVGGIGAIVSTLRTGRKK
jgi:XrtJ-associated TM-motif-TM protein